MASASFFSVKQGALFVQQNLSADPVYLGCEDLGDVAAPEGDYTLVQVFDVQGNYETLGATKGAPTPITFTITGYIQEKAHFLESLACPFFLHANLRCGGYANVINNYERAVILKVFGRTGRTLKAIVMREGEGKAEQDFDLSAAPPILDVYRLTVDRQSTSEVLALNDIYMISAELCAGCTPAYGPGSIGLAVADSAADPATANARYTLNKGADWTACATDPFTTPFNIACVTAFWISGKVIRFLVGNGTTQAGAPAQVAYTDFNVETDTAIGAVWTRASVGSTNAQFFFGPKALYAYDQYNIWAVVGAGFIYKSTNGGLTWTAQESGVLTTEDYYCIAAVPGSKTNIWVAGENDAIARTRDGGVTWSAVTGGNATAEALTIDVVDDQTVFVGYNDGELWATYNGGVSWSQITFSMTGTPAQVRAVKFLNEMQGFMLVNTSAPLGTLLVTRDGGRSWEALSTPTNAGLNALAVVSNKDVWAVGEALTSLAVILKTVN